MTWLKLYLKKMNLRRRVPDPDYNTIKAIIVRELRTSNNLKGYRSMWSHICKKYNLIVKRYVTVFFDKCY